MSKDKTLEIKASRVRELAEECADYKKAMQILFPEAFKEKYAGNVTNEIKTELKYGVGLRGERDVFICLKHNGEEIGEVLNVGIVIDREGYKKHVEN